MDTVQGLRVRILVEAVDAGRIGQRANPVRTQGDILFALRKNGTDYPASVLSDGTLRFAAIAAAFFQPSPPHTLILKEIEDGLHPPGSAC